MTTWAMPGMAQPIEPRNDGTPYGSGFVLDADSKPDFMFNYEWDHLQRKRQANRRAAYDREYLGKYAPPPPKEQKPIEPYITQQVGLTSMLVPNPEWGMKNGMASIGGSWIPMSLFGGASGSMSDYFGGDIIPRLGQQAPYSAYGPGMSGPWPPSPPQQYRPAPPTQPRNELWGQW